MATKKTTAKKTAKPKTMASRRQTTVATRRTGGATESAVFKSIVSSILQTRKKTFTSTEIAQASSASPRHSRRTLAALAASNVLRVRREQAPFEYSVASRESLRRMAR